MRLFHGQVISNMLQAYASLEAHESTGSLRKKTLACLRQWLWNHQALKQKPSFTVKTHSENTVNSLLKTLLKQIQGQAAWSPCSAQALSEQPAAVSISEHDYIENYVLNGKCPSRKILINLAIAKIALRARDVFPRLWAGFSHLKPSCLKEVKVCHK